MHNPIELIVQATPNPRAFKFVSSLELMPEGWVEYLRADYPAGHPVCEVLFAHPGVESVYVAGGFISVRFAAEPEPQELAALRPQLLTVLRNATESPFPTGLTPTGDEHPVAEWFRTRILPATQQDGGGIFFERFADGEISVRTRGACTGCPYLSLTLERGVLEPLKQRHPDLHSVRPI